jgi:PAS domain S-box-containing protein
MGRLGSIVARRSDGEEFPIEASISQFDFSGKKRMTVILRDITERRKIEEELEKEKQFIATILDTAGALVVVLDPEWRIVRFNRVCENLTGRTLEEMRGKSFLDLTVVSGEGVPELKDMLASFHDKQFPIAFENAWLNHDRQLCWISWSNTVIMDQQGEIENIIATGIDITGRKQAEQVMEGLAIQNRLILDSAGEGIYGIDNQGRATFLNRAAEALTGWKFQELEGRVMHSLLHHTRNDGTPYPPEECPVYISATNGSFHQVDTENLWRKDGTSFPVAYTCSPIKNTHNKVEGVVVTFKDITDRKKAEDSLRESEERFQAFMDHNPVVAFLKNEKGQYVYVNRQFEEKFHLLQANCLGKTDSQLFPPEVARIFKEHDREILKTREMVEAEETTLDEKGNIRYWWVMKFLVPWRKGQVHLGGVALDLTARKEIEEALRVREGELRHSHELLQALGRQFITAQEDERRRISRELHDDMNQRLAVLALTIQSAQKGFGQSTPMFQTFQKLYDEVSSLSDDVRRLAYQLHPSILDDLGLEVALRAFISDFSKWEGIPVAFVSTDVPFSVTQVIASCLYRVAQECLRNVTRHAKATQVDVKLLGKDDGLTLSITDNGKGFKVAETHVGKHGLGLLGMQERVRAVQGTFEIKSAPGKGTEITVWVPMGNVRNESEKLKEKKGNVKG